MQPKYALIHCLNPWYTTDSGFDYYVYLVKDHPKYEELLELLLNLLSTGGICKIIYSLEFKYPGTIRYLHRVSVIKSSGIQFVDKITHIINYKKFKSGEYDTELVFENQRDFTFLLDTPLEILLEKNKKYCVTGVRYENATVILFQYESVFELRLKNTLIFERNYSASSIFHSHIEKYLQYNDKILLIL